MQNVLVIADDFTGAAEIAGIGHRYGLSTCVLRKPPERFMPGLTVVDTDSRSLGPADAAQTVSRVTSSARLDAFDLIYKKTDSVLRGPISVELAAIVKRFGLRDALLVPQNPSRGRVIINGEYRIGDTPLHETAFANDPIHPIRSSRASDLVPGIRVGDGSSHAELLAWAARLDRSILPAGGADFFSAILEHAGLTTARGPLDRLTTGRRLYVCGSASTAARVDRVPTCPMLEPTQRWCDAVCRALDSASRAAMTIDRPLNASASLRFEAALAKAAACVVRRGGVSNLLVTGGATASAVCRELGWNRFELEGEFAVGVVQLRPANTTAPSLIVKPGSYAWPPAVIT